MITKISIIIPIFNEKKNIIKLINEIKKKLIFIKYEVIFVDDNSTDGSIDILKRIKFIDKRFGYIIHRGPRDLTQSCFKGIEIAKSDLIVIMDGDLQHNPTYIKFLYQKIINDKSDIVIASRNFNKTNTKTLSLVRITFSRMLIFLLKIISGKNYIDPMSGYFIFKKKIYFENRKIFFGKGYKILADFIYNIPMIKVSEIYINFRGRDKGNSKMSIKILIILIIFMIKRFLRI